jgi:hypothetical protein
MKMYLLCLTIVASLSVAPKLVSAQSAAYPNVASVFGNTNNGQSARHAHSYDANGVCYYCDKQKPNRLASLTITIHPIHITIPFRGKDAIKGKSSQ